ncbi:MAG: trypsin-like peptidase domain-containing protein [Oligoflexia bacterium]|nr:trypsin-like peptidase domain-containing protein [Oligoflexia bacterium]
MKIVKTVLTTALCALIGAQAIPAASSIVAPADLPDLVEKILPGVVNISSTTVTNYQVFGMDEFLRLWGVPQERKQTSLGSGFIIDDDGYVLTNNHVVAHATEVLVTLYDKRNFKAKIIGKDDKLDLALLQIRGPNHKLPAGISPVPLGDSEKVRIGESVFAVGNPFGFQHTVTAGIISAKNRTIGQGPFDNFLQTDASINPGNSGGPLFNLKGEVIGINSAIISKTGQSGGLGFAIPIKAAKDIIPDLKRYGRVPRPWLGVLGQTITPALAHMYSLQVEQGVAIYNLVEGAPADHSGLMQGDLIIGIDGLKVSDIYELERDLAKHRPTESAQLEILRGHRKLNLTVQLEELPRLEDLPQGII